jgi:hypothetical protein
VSKPKTSVTPHVHVIDQDVPADPLATGDPLPRVCRTCQLVGVPGDSHHTMPDPVPDAAGLAAGEGGDA